MKADERKAGALAAQDLEDIRTLKKSPAWSRYWARQVVGPADRLRDRILTDSKLTKDELWELRIRFEERLDVVNTIIRDEAACRSIIEGLPREPEESEDSPATQEE